MTWTFDPSGLPSAEETRRRVAKSNARYEEMCRRSSERWTWLESHPHYVVEYEGLRAIVAWVPNTDKSSD